jgi:glutamate dehydrogenase (NAD(P)+)
VNGGVYNPRGLDFEKLEQHFDREHTVVGFDGGDPVSNEDLLIQPCDVLVPAAMERQITEANAARIQCRILAEGANGPTTPGADLILNRRPEIFVIPDILCNAGGVIVSYFEWVQDLQSFFWGETEVTDRLYRLLEGAFVQTTRFAKERKVPMRMAALSLGIERVWKGKLLRGLFP